jgi:hypothetical protein
MHIKDVCAVHLHEFPDQRMLALDGPLADPRDAGHNKNKRKHKGKESGREASC